MPQEHYTPVTTFKTMQGEEVPYMMYRGFQIRRLHEHVLFEIVPHEGMKLPAALQGLHTKVTNIYDQVDKYFRDYPDMTAEKLIVTKPTSIPKHRELEDVKA